MEADDSLVDDSAERQPIEQIIYLVKHRVYLFWVLTKTIGALRRKAEAVVDHAVFVVSSQQMNLIWEFDFESHEQTDRLQ